MKKKLLLILLTLSSFYANSQHYRNLSLKDYKTWSLQGNVGLNYGNTDIVENNLFYTHVKTNVGYGLRLTKFLTNNFALSIDGYRGNLEGSNDKFKYSTDINYQLSGLLQIQTGNIRYIDEFKNFQLYGYIGYGTINYSSTLIANNPTKNNKVKENQQVIPVGIGIKYHLKENITLHLEYSSNRVNGDNLDAYNDYYTEYDQYNRFQFGISYTFGNKDDVVLEWHDPRPRPYNVPPRKDTVVIIQKNSESEMEALNQKYSIDSTLLYNLIDSLENRTYKTTIYYDFNKWECPIVFNSRLGDICLAVLNEPGKRILINSYCDTIGSEENNKIIVQKRANSVVEKLLSFGISNNLIEVKLHDENDAILPSDAENRRTTITIK